MYFFLLDRPRDPFIVIYPSISIQKIGGNAKFLCSGIPRNGRAVWSFQEGELRKNTKQVNNSVIITKITERNFGLYTCLAIYFNQTVGIADARLMSKNGVLRTI